MRFTISRKSLPPGFDLQGHRGCRGLYPENSIPAFKKALELKVTTLEMDLVISRDRKVVVSHEPYFNHLFTITPEGKELSEKDERSFNLYRMDYEEIKQFDVGSKPHPHFPNQKKMKARKPLLEEVIELAEHSHQNPPVWYNVEIKSFPGEDNIFHPPVEEYSDLVIEVVKRNRIMERTTIQSFDLRTLQYIYQEYPYQKLSLLVENDLSPDMNIRLLGFIPEVYSPYYKLVDEALVHYCKDLNMKLIPWTVNETEAAVRLINMGVDGLITDYPDIFE